IPRCYLVSYLETQSPSLAEPVIEAASPINEVLRALPKRQSVSAGDKRNCLAVSPELIDHSRREQSKTFAKSAPRKEEVAEIDRSSQPALDQTLGSASNVDRGACTFTNQDTWREKRISIARPGYGFWRLAKSDCAEKQEETGSRHHMLSHVFPPIHQIQ